MIYLLIFMGLVYLARAQLSFNSAAIVITPDNMNPDLVLNLTAADLELSTDIADVTGAVILLCTNVDTGTFPPAGSDCQVKVYALPSTSIDLIGDLIFKSISVLAVSPVFTTTSDSEVDLSAVLSDPAAFTLSIGATAAVGSDSDLSVALSCDGVGAGPLVCMGSLAASLGNNAVQFALDFEFSTDLCPEYALDGSFDLNIAMIQHSAEQGDEGDDETASFTANVTGSYWPCANATNGESLLELDLNEVSFPESALSIPGSALGGQMVAMVADPGDPCSLLVSGVIELELQFSLFGSSTAVTTNLTVTGESCTQYDVGVEIGVDSEFGPPGYEVEFLGTIAYYGRFNKKNWGVIAIAIPGLEAPSSVFADLDAPVDDPPTNSIPISLPDFFSGVEISADGTNFTFGGFGGTALASGSIPTSQIDPITEEYAFTTLAADLFDGLGGRLTLDGRTLDSDPLSGNFITGPLDAPANFSDQTFAFPRWSVPAFDPTPLGGPAAVQAIVAGSLPDELLFPLEGPAAQLETSGVPTRFYLPAGLIGESSGVELSSSVFGTRLSLDGLAADIRQLPGADSRVWQGLLSANVTLGGVEAAVTLLLSNDDSSTSSVIRLLIIEVAYRDTTLDLVGNFVALPGSCPAVGAVSGSLEVVLRLGTGGGAKTTLVADASHYLCAPSSGDLVWALNTTASEFTLFSGDLTVYDLAVDLQGTRGANTDDVDWAAQMSATFRDFLNFDELSAAIEYANGDISSIDLTVDSAPFSSLPDDLTMEFTGDLHYVHDGETSGDLEFNLTASFLGDTGLTGALSVIKRQVDAAALANESVWTFTGSIDPFELVADGTTLASFGGGIQAVVELDTIANSTEYSAAGAFAVPEFAFAVVGLEGSATIEFVDPGAAEVSLAVAYSGSSFTLAGDLDMTLPLDDCTDASLGYFDLTFPEHDGAEFNASVVYTPACMDTGTEQTIEIDANGGSFSVGDQLDLTAVAVSMTCVHDGACAGSITASASLFDVIAHVAADFSDTEGLTSASVSLSVSESFVSIDAVLDWDLTGDDCGTVSGTTSLSMQLTQSADQQADEIQVASLAMDYDSCSGEANITGTADIGDALSGIVGDFSALNDVTIDLRRVSDGMGGFSWTVDLTDGDAELSYDGSTADLELILSYDETVALPGGAEITVKGALQADASSKRAAEASVEFTGTCTVTLTGLPYSMADMSLTVTADVTKDEDSGDLTGVFDGTISTRGFSVPMGDLGTLTSSEIGMEVERRDDGSYIVSLYGAFNDDLILFVALDSSESDVEAGLVISQATSLAALIDAIVPGASPIDSDTAQHLGDVDAFVCVLEDTDGSIRLNALLKAEVFGVSVVSRLLVTSSGAAFVAALDVDDVSSWPEPLSYLGDAISDAGDVKLRVSNTDFTYDDLSLPTLPDFLPPGATGDVGDDFSAVEPTSGEGLSSGFSLLIAKPLSGDLSDLVSNSAMSSDSPYGQSTSDLGDDSLLVFIASFTWGADAEVTLALNLPLPANTDAGGGATFTLTDIQLILRASATELEAGFGVVMTFEPAGSSPAFVGTFTGDMLFGVTTDGPTLSLDASLTGGDKWSDPLGLGASTAVILPLIFDIDINLVEGIPSKIDLAGGISIGDLDIDFSAGISTESDEEFFCLSVENFSMHDLLDPLVCPSNPDDPDCLGSVGDVITDIDVDEAVIKVNTGTSTVSLGGDATCATVPSGVQLELTGLSLWSGTIDIPFLCFSVSESGIVAAVRLDELKLGSFLTIASSDNAACGTVPETPGTCEFPSDLTTPTGPQFAMSTEPANAYLFVSGQVSLFGFVDVDVCVDITSTSVVVSGSIDFFESVKLVVTVTSSVSTSPPSFSFMFTAEIDGDIIAAVIDEITDAINYIIEEAQKALEDANAALQSAKEKVEDAEADVASAQATVNAAIASAVAKVASAEASVDSIESTCHHYDSKCHWYSPWYCAAYAACEITKDAADAVLDLAEDAIEGAGDVADAALDVAEDALVAAEATLSAAQLVVKGAEATLSAMESVLDAALDVADFIKLDTISLSAGLSASSSSASAELSFRATGTVFKSNFDFSFTASLDFDSMLNALKNEIVDEFKSLFGSIISRKRNALTDGGVPAVLQTTDPSGRRAYYFRQRKGRGGSKLNNRLHTIRPSLFSHCSVAVDHYCSSFPAKISQKHINFEITQFQGPDLLRAVQCTLDYIATKFSATTDELKILILITGPSGIIAEHTPLIALPYLPKTVDVRIKATDVGFVGPLDSSWTNRAKWLCLANNHLTGRASEIQWFREVEKFDIANNDVAIDCGFFDTIEDLPHLLSYKVQNNVVENPSCLANPLPTSLRYLYGNMVIAGAPYDGVCSPESCYNALKSCALGLCGNSAQLSEVVKYIAQFTGESESYIDVYDIVATDEGNTQVLFRSLAPYNRNHQIPLFMGERKRALLELDVLAIEAGLRCPPGRAGKECALGCIHGWSAANGCKPPAVSAHCPKNCVKALDFAQTACKEAVDLGAGAALRSNKVTPCREAMDAAAVACAVQHAKVKGMPPLCTQRLTVNDGRDALRAPPRSVEVLNKCALTVLQGLDCLIPIDTQVKAFAKKLKYKLGIDIDGNEIDSDDDDDDDDDNNDDDDDDDDDSDSDDDADDDSQSDEKK